MSVDVPDSHLQEAFRDFNDLSRDDLIEEIIHLRTRLVSAERDRAVLHAILNNFPDAVYAGSSRGAWMCNEPALKLFGFDTEEEFSRNVFQLSEEVDARFKESGSPIPPAESALALALHGDSFVRNITIRNRKTGKEHTLRSAGVPVWLGDEVAGAVVINTDITEFADIAQALRESEARFRTMADTAPVMIWVSDTDKKCTYLNEVWLTFTGRGLEDELGFGWLAGVHPDDVDRCRTIYSSSFDARKEFRMEYRLQRADGMYRWVLDHGTPRNSPDGTFSGYIGSCIDITDRKQGDLEREELLEREKNAREASQIAERRTAFLAEASAALASSLDYETTLQRVADLIVPRLADWCAVDILDENDQIHLVAVAHVDPQKVKWARELRRRYPINPDESTGVANVIRTGDAEFYPDIPEELLAAAARDEEHLAIIHQIGFRSVMILPLTVRNETLGAITFVWSDSACNYSEDDFRFANQLAQRAAVAVDNARLYSALQKERLRLKSLAETLEERVQDRTKEILETNEKLRVEAEERERTQRALARSHKALEGRNRELQDFAYVASHDLQEPLRKIRAFTQLLQTDHREELNEEGQLFLDRIDNAATRMSQFINDLLTYSRIATRAQSYTRVDLKNVVKDVLSDLEISIAESGGVIEYGALCELEADPLQMRQLFQNLIGNALKFRRQGVPPLIRIRSNFESTFFEGAPHQSACCLEVEDNGIGFEERFLDQIFAPFQRLHGTGTYPGTGMGLAICRRIVERHHGRISASSAPGSGSTFSVMLPISQAFWLQNDEPGDESARQQSKKAS